jgi:Flp pilus assembly pilin Flp
MTFLLDENGQSIVEYALIVGILAVAAIVVLVAFGPKIQGIFNKADNGVNSANKSDLQ